MPYSKMLLAIMTRGRVGKQTTLKSIPKELLSRTVLVVPQEEVGKHSVPCRVVGAPESVANYSQKFQWILNGMEGIAPSKVIILDDDLVFSTRRGNSLVTVRNPEDLTLMFEQMRGLLESFPLVGVHPRQMGQDAPDGWVENGRIICVQGINRDLVGAVKVDQFPILADVILNCTLLARGQKNALITSYFQDHGPCQAPGGCSIYRTPEMQHRAVRYLSERWPGFVKVVERKVKTKWLQNEEGVRYDYRAYWKKLYLAGLDYARGLRSSPDREVWALEELAKVGEHK